MPTPLLIAALLALGGCAASYTEPTLPADHPANLAAEEAPSPMRWSTLDTAAVGPVGSMPAEPAMDHSGHEGDEKTAPLPEKRDYEDETPPRGAAAPGTYACPMHAEVTSDKADQRCPKCGMKLKKQDGGKQP